MLIPDIAATEAIATNATTASVTGDGSAMKIADVD
jgi:hypothetical protein